VKETSCPWGQKEKGFSGDHEGKGVAKKGKRLRKGGESSFSDRAERSGNAGDLRTIEEEGGVRRLTYEKA